MSLLPALLLTFFRIGLFSFGGGYAAIALILSEVVKGYGWLSEADFLQLITLAEMTPGPIAINTATFVGYRVAGPAGAAVSTLGLVLPSLLIMGTAFHFYSRLQHLGQIKSVMAVLRPAVAGVLGAAAFSLAAPTLVSPLQVGIFLVSLLLYLRFKPHPLLVIAAAGLVGLLFS